MARLGKGRKTRQYNPGAKTLGAYVAAAVAHRPGAHDAGGKILHETPKWKRREFAGQIWALRRQHGTDRRPDNFDWDTGQTVKHNAAHYDVEDVAQTPRGYHVRTVLQGPNRLRFAFPPGRRQKGAGVLVQILRPKHNPAEAQKIYPGSQWEQIRRVMELARTTFPIAARAYEASGGNVHKAVAAAKQLQARARSSNPMYLVEGELKRGGTQRAGYYYGETKAQAIQRAKDDIVTLWGHDSPYKSLHAKKIPGSNPAGLHLSVCSDPDFTAGNPMKPGNKVFYDGAGGLIPATVVSFEGDHGPASSSQRVKLKLTGARPGYRKGEIIETSGLHAVPRSAVRRRGGQQRIGYYENCNPMPRVFVKKEFDGQWYVVAQVPGYPPAAHSEGFSKRADAEAELPRIKRELKQANPLHYRFRDLRVGDTFDFIDDDNPSRTSFYKRVQKISARKYKAVDDGMEYRVGSTSAKVFHVSHANPCGGRQKNADWKPYKVVFHDGRKIQSWVQFRPSLAAARTGAAEDVKREYPQGRVISVAETADPRNKNTRRRNSGGADMYKTFHGRPAQEISEHTEQLLKLGDYAAIGDDPELWLEPVKGQPGRWPKPDIEFLPSDGVKLATDAAGQDLYFIGGNQKLPAEFFRQMGLATGRRFIPLGTVYGISYKTEKSFDNFKTGVYAHEFGEETGERPSAVYDSELHRILLIGGAYRIGPVDPELGASPGIEN